MADRNFAIAGIRFTGKFWPGLCEEEGAFIDRHRVQDPGKI